MRRGWHGAVFVFVAVLAARTSAQPRRASTPATHQTQQAAPNPTLNRAEALLEAHKWQAAHDLIVPWLKANPTAPDRDRGLFLLAEVYYQNGDRIRAFYHLDELMDNYPDSKLFFPALELQYQIADGYLNGFKNRDPIFDLAIVPAYDEAIEMLYRIQERSPGSPLAERAMKRTADYYFNTSQFDLAGDAYAAFIRSYPRSPDIPQVKLRLAFSSLAQFRGPPFDATPLIDARSQFRDVQAHYPELAADANVSGWIDRIDADLARKLYITADFYRRTNRLTGAVFMYRHLIETYPNSHEADLARQDLGRMPKWALSAPAPPPPGNPESAATQPAVMQPPRPGTGERLP